MLQRFAQFCIALLQFLEQPGVLDGDHCLVREGLEEHGFLFGEWTNLNPTDGYCADHPTVADHRHTEGGVEVECLAERLAIICVCLRVRDMHNRSLEDDAPVYASPRWAHWEHVPHHLGALGGHMRVSCQMYQLTVVP